VSLTRSDATPRSRTKRGSAMDARLHTAVSSGLVYSRISVHRLLHLIVPCRDTSLIMIMKILQVHVSVHNPGGVVSNTKQALNRALPGNKSDHVDGLIVRRINHCSDQGVSSQTPSKQLAAQVPQTTDSASSEILA